MKKRMMILFAVMFVLSISCAYADVLPPSSGTSLDNKIGTIIGLVQMILLLLYLYCRFIP